MEYKKAKLRATENRMVTREIGEVVFKGTNLQVAGSQSWDLNHSKVITDNRLHNKLQSYQ